MLDILYNIIQNSLWGKSLVFQKLSHVEFEQLMQHSRNQTLDGIVAGSLIRNKVILEKMDAIHVYALSEKIKNLNSKVTEALTSLSKLLSLHKIPYYVFKGQTIERHYPHKSERIPGDIDFYVDTEHFIRAKEIIEKEWNVSMEMEELGLHYNFVYRGVIFELHHDMIQFEDSDNQTYWNTILNSEPPIALQIEGVKIPTLCPTLNLLYTFLHMYHHLVELGVGFRQFYDLACLLKVYHDEIDGKVLEQHLNELGFKNAFVAIGWILIDKLGLPKEYFPIQLNGKERKYEKRILDIVIHGGNFGFSSVKGGFRNGLKYYVGAFFRKINHYRIFWHLSRKEIKARTLKGLPKKVYASLR